MNTKLASVLTLSAVTLALAACEPHERRMEMNHPQHPGSYSSTETATDAQGTTTVKTTTTTVTVDDEGNRKEVITSKITKDPRGLMNKKTTHKTSETLEQK